MNRYIPEPLEEEIRDRYYLVLARDISDIKLKADKLEKKALATMAQIHSFRMEHPELRVPFCVPKNSHKKSIRRGFENLKQAYKWGVRNFNPNEFNESFVRGIAGRILPEIYDRPLAQYRTTGTSITGSSTTPPYPSKLTQKEIPHFERAMKEKLKSPYEIDRVEAAIFAHFHIARMHPFVDGNGRTSRLVQDVILNHFGFPLPLIEVGERNTYYNLLDAAIVDWKAQNNWDNDLITKGERNFYMFMAGKVNSSLDKLTCALEIEH